MKPRSARTTTSALFSLYARPCAPALCGRPSRTCASLSQALRVALAAGVPGCICILLSLGLLGCSEGGRSGIAPGDRAPQIEGVDLSGSSTTLYAVTGLPSSATRVVLVNFWATWCAPCLQELPALERLSRRLRSQGLQVVGIAVNDTLENVTAVRDRYDVTFPLLIDAQGVSKRAYQLKGFPESFVLDADHRIVLLQDPAQSGSLVAKIVGPREWAAPRAVSIFEQLLQRQPGVAVRQSTVAQPE